jgi:toxin ParE1/3/4
MFGNMPLGFKRFLIFYRVTDDGVDILRVLHGARDVEMLLEGNDLWE